MSKQSTSLSNKSCYRLYIGNGNWINLNARTTQDLLNIFERGEPCRYQLAPGLSIDIIPHDVDCNSKNIDLVGLMRADLVYEPQLTEHQVQQLMSHYVRNLLEEQNIVDVFPPIRSNESLPVVTSISAHRHLSLVPMVFGTVRRGPKSQSMGPRAARFLRNVNPSTSPSSSSSSASVNNQDEQVISSSASSNATGDTSSSSTSSYPSNSLSSFRNKRPSVTTRGMKSKTKRQNSTKRGQRQNSHVVLPSVELTSQKISSLTTSNFSEGHHPINMRSFPSYAHPSNNMSTVIGPYHNSQTNDHLLGNHPSNMWMQTYNQVLPSAGEPSSSHHLSGQDSKGFDFEFNVDFDQPSTHRQSSADILQEYDHHFSSRQNFSDNHSADEFYNLQHHNLLNNQIRQPQQQMNASKTEATTTATTESSSPLENYVPTSPIPNAWIHSTQPQSRQAWPLNFDESIKSEKDISKTFTFENPTANNEPTKRQPLCEVTTLPMIDKVMFQQEESNHCDNILLNNSNDANKE
ncbi:hypothetical protein BD560DRAFT_386156 [Blakeslea trispora]|nr:hypothetical protein BD560DRAFT_386156 [Blakeslea trispora]